MGGAVQHHIYEKTYPGTVGCLVFLGISAYVPIVRGVPAA
jgi:hypothetical protein